MADDPLENVYKQALRWVDEDNLHDVLVRTQLKALQRGIPYLIVAARGQKLSDLRTESRRRAILEQGVPAPAPSIDPYHQVVRNEQHRALIEALSTLPDPDLLTVWHHFHGMPDQEILAALRRLDPAFKSLTVEVVRKRRQRALAKLRKMLAEPTKP